LPQAKKRRSNAVARETPDFDESMQLSEAAFGCEAGGAGKRNSLYEELI